MPRCSFRKIRKTTKHLIEFKVINKSLLKLQKKNLISDLHYKNHCQYFSFGEN